MWKSKHAVEKLRYVEETIIGRVIKLCLQEQKHKVSKINDLWGVSKKETYTSRLGVDLIKVI